MTHKKYKEGDTKLVGYMPLPTAFGMIQEPIFKKLRKGKWVYA